MAIGAIAEDPRCATNASRSAAREWLIPALAQVIGAMDLNEVSRRLEAAKIPFAPVQRPSDLLGDPHLLASGELLDTALSPTGEGGPRAGIPALPMEFGDERGRLGLRRQPARIDEHSREVLAEGGFGTAEIDTLLRGGTVRDHSDARHDTRRQGDTLAATE
jgi:crotonobetainyl-CoA:carnitine CoA-transferase CaiB-like acyl-CoA transferase